LGHWLKPPGTERLKLEYGGPLSNFAFKFNLRRYIMDKIGAMGDFYGEDVLLLVGRSLQSFTLELNLSRF
jgi:hypothetical protein